MIQKIFKPAEFIADPMTVGLQKEQKRLKQSMIVIVCDLCDQVSNNIINKKQQMKPTQFKLRPEVHLGNIKLQQLAQYPDLQRRVNNQNFELTGIHNLIVELRKQTIEQLKEEFINNNNDVNLHQFMWLISNSIMIRTGQGKSIQEQYYQYEIQYQIVKVFQEIDIDNSNSISWEEYIEYITSSSLMEINQNSQQQLSALTAEDKKIKQLNFSHKEKTLFRKNAIRKIIQIEKLNMIGIVQKKSDTLSFFTSIGGILPKPFQLNGIDRSKVLSLDYSDEDRVFGVLMNSHHVIFVEDGEMQKVHGENKFSGDQIEIIYLKMHKLWLLITLDNTLQIFTLQKGRKKQNQTSKILLKFKPHEQQLIDVKELANPLSIVTASWNGSMKIWSLSLNQLLIQLNPCKEEDFLQCKSIKGFQVYNNQLTSFMICWLFSPELSVWLPSSSLTKPYLGKLKGHIGIVQQAKFLTNFPICVSLDNKNSIRVWDLSKMQCIQTWKLQTNFTAKLGVLRSVPYVLVYDKLIQFYKSTKQANFIEYNTQKSTTIPINLETKPLIAKKVEKQQKKGVKILQTNLNDFSDETHKEKGAENKKKVKQQKSSKNFEPEIQQFQYRSKTADKRNIVIQVLYDNYLDCLIILAPQSLSLVAVNTGKVLNKIHTENKNEVFVTMCLKQNRRLFLANNMGQVSCLKIQDCSILYKIFPYQQILTNARAKQKQKKKNTQSQEFEKSSTNIDRMQKSSVNLKVQNQYDTFALDFNSYNQVLLITAESQCHSVIITYDNFSAFQPFKKKEVIFDQQNLCAFASSPKHNLFYIGSNDPSIISMWDYHNFVILRSIQLPNRIVNLSVQDTKYSILLVAETTGLRIFKTLPIDARNNTRTADLNLISHQFHIKSIRTIFKAHIMHVKYETSRRRAKKHKVTFNDEQQMTKKQDNIQKRQKLQIFVLSNSIVTILSLQQIEDDMKLQIVVQPYHSQKANITKQSKKMQISPIPCSAGSDLSCDMHEITKQTIQTSKSNTVVLGKTNDLVYFQDEVGVLYFYKPSEAKTWARMSMPKCQIIQWQICYNLVSKIITRLKKAEQISRAIYAYKRKQKQDEAKIQYLRISFILNKYFTQQDIKGIKNYFNNSQKIRKVQKVQKQGNEPLIKIENNQKKLTISKGNQSTYFNQQIQERNRLRSQTAEKMKQIQKKYSKIFTFIKAKIENQKQQQLNIGKGARALSKFRSTSVQKLSKNTELARRDSNSSFKIRNTLSSANKMYFEHSKQIKNSLNKIGILNNKIRNLKI